MDADFAANGGPFYRREGENCNIRLDIVRDNPVTLSFPESPRNPPHLDAMLHPSWVSCGVFTPESIHNV
jgi:hypothetical protein